MRFGLGAFALVVLALTSACASSHDAADDETDTEDAELVLSNLELDVPVLSDFPSRPRDQANALGARDAEIGAWNLHFVRTQDGFEGLLAYGAQADGQLRYLMAFDAKNKSVMLLDGVQAAAQRDAKSASSGGESAESAFVARAFDEVTVAWLRSEMDRMIAALEAQLDDTGTGLAVQSLSPKEVCALRLAIYAAAMVVPYTKLPLVGRGASLTGQFVGSFLIDAVGSAAIGQLTDAAKSAAASAAAGIALESVLREGGRLIQNLGASSAGFATGFIVGAILGTDGELVLLPGDKVEKLKDGTTTVLHADGTRTIIPTTGVARLLPAACRQALGDSRAGR